MEHGATWKTQSSRNLSLECMHRGNISVVWIRLLQHTLLSLLVTFLMYLYFYIFYCLLNGFFWLCFVWSSLHRKQFCSGKHFANCLDEERASASLASNVPSWSWLWIHKSGFQPSHHWRYQFTLWLETRKEPLSATVITQELSEQDAELLS